MSNEREFFKPVISRWPSVIEFAAEVGCSEYVARRWRWIDSIPAGWFGAVERAAIKRGWADITIPALAAIAEQRRLFPPPSKEPKRRRRQAVAA